MALPNSAGGIEPDPSRQASDRRFSGNLKPNDIPRDAQESESGGPANGVGVTALATGIDRGQSAGGTDLGGASGTGGGTAAGGGETALGMRDTGAGTDLGGGQDTGSAIDREQMASAVRNKARSDREVSKR
jgi:hypothetical protein